MAKATETSVGGKKRKNKLKYGKWGIIFILPFFITYAIFQIYPLFSTFYKSFFQQYKILVDFTDPVFVGFDNFKTVFQEGYVVRYLGNTFIMWILGFVPQIIMSLLFASWFTDLRLKLKGTGFYKVILYLPNILMASSVAVLFFTLFGNRGPVNDILAKVTGNKEYFDLASTTVFNFFASVWGTRGIAAFINYLMWTGNTTILLMAGIMGVDPALYEAASIDGAGSRQLFRKITLPLLRPIMLYVFITSLIGGIQMFDIPQLLTFGQGTPDNTSMTVVMFLNNNLANRNYGIAGAISVILFVVAAVLSIIVYKLLSGDSGKKPKKKKIKSIQAERSVVNNG